MYTEDDTFRKLRQTPFDEFISKWREERKKQEYCGTDKFFEKHGWTSEEYWHE